MKFVMSHRRAGKFRETEKLASRAALSSVASAIPASAQLVSQNAPARETARQTMILEGTEGRMRELQQNAPEDVIVEPLIEHHIDRNELGVFAGSQVVPLNHGVPTGTGQTFTFRVRGGGRPLANAEVLLVVRPQSGAVTTFSANTDAAGTAVFNLSPLFQALSVIAVPYAGFWAMRAFPAPSITSIVCPPLPQRQRIDWWHRATGFGSYDETAGAGVRVGVLDTGFGPHGHLNGTDEGAFINSGFDATGGADVDRHGSHVSGTIAGRPGADLRHAGMAPGATLFSVRVFPPDAGASNVDIANAIDFLSRERQCDLINMSLGAASPSALIRDAIQDAFERGTLCICAAANSSGPVEFPAAFPEAVAISAAGRLGEAPNSSISAGRTPNDPALFGADQLFFANFSCFGNEIESIAPGVGIVATVPARHGLVNPYAALDGTSMASPVACGTLARALAEDAAYLASGRDQNRARMARAKLAALCKSIGLPRVRQGAGLPVD